MMTKAWNSSYRSLVLWAMSEESDRFRMRARQCREQAALAREPNSRDTLTQMAVDLDEEAARIDAEESDAE